MTVFPVSSSRPRHLSRKVHLLPIALGGTFAASAIALVAYLLWPTWGAGPSSAPAKLPVSIGGTLFNLPTAAVRMKIQRHSGPQERVDLDFLYPSLEPPGAPKHVSAADANQPLPPVDRIFVSISAHHDALAPELRATTIYPRYLDQATTPLQGGLTMRAFRAETPYGDEDLFSAASPALVARCTRDASTPGMCLSERRIGGADLTFRFPRSWLGRWQDVAGALDRLAAQLHGPQ